MRIHWLCISWYFNYRSEILILKTHHKVLLVPMISPSFNSWITMFFLWNPTKSIQTFWWNHHVPTFFDISPVVSPDFPSLSHIFPKFFRGFPHSPGPRGPWSSTLISAPRMPSAHHKRREARTKATCDTTRSSRCAAASERMLANFSQPVKTKGLSDGMGWRWLFWWSFGLWRMVISWLVLVKFWFSWMILMGMINGCIHGYPMKWRRRACRIGGWLVVSNG